MRKGQRRRQREGSWETLGRTDHSGTSVDRHLAGLSPGLHWGGGRQCAREPRQKEILHTNLSMSLPVHLIPQYSNCSPEEADSDFTDTMEGDPEDLHPLAFQWGVRALTSQHSR